MTCWNTIDRILKVWANFQSIVQKLIPPERTQCKKIEGSELLNYIDGEETIDNLQPAEQSDNSNQFSINEQNDQGTFAPDWDNDVPTNTQVPAEPCVISSLQNICNDNQANKVTK